MPDSILAGNWSKLIERLKVLDERLVIELEACSHEIQTLLETQCDSALSISDFPSLSTLSEFKATRLQLSSALLREAAAYLEKVRPHQRVINAFEIFDRNIENLIRTFPETVRLSGPEALEVIESNKPKTWLVSLCRLRRKEFSFPLRDFVKRELISLRNQRANTEGRYILGLSLAIHRIRDQWRNYRASFDAAILGSRIRASSIADDGATEGGVAFAAEQLRTAISGIRELSSSAPDKIASALVSEIALRKGTSGVNLEVRRRNLEHWGVQLRTVLAEVQLATELEQCEDELLKLSQNLLDSCAQEEMDLICELDEFASWIAMRLQGGSSNQIPPPSADIIPAASRLAEFESEFRNRLALLPPSKRVLKRLSALPKRSRLGTAREIFPRKTLQNAFEITGRASIASLLEGIEAGHRRLVQEIERARDVVSFGLEQSSSSIAKQSGITVEALQNAKSLLEFDRSELTDWSSEADATMLRSMVAVFAEARSLLGRDRLGVFAYLAQQGLQRVITTTAENLAIGSKRFLSQTINGVQSATLKFLVHIGWRAKPSAGLSDVVTRPFLPVEYTTDLTAKELPAIYRRLFRREPVEDPRFLVGRESEMEAIAQARDFWEAGRPVALIIVGERGSGKTSLINCALKRTFCDLETVRGEFSERLFTEADLRKFLMSVLGSPSQDNLEAFLSERRRVVILEELERTFLRQVGYYSALRGFQRLIAATCSSTLWVVVVNQVAFNFLNAALTLGQSFSHRINAATVTQVALRRAILVRHNLSGLRLQFAEPVERARLRAWIRSTVEGQQDAETAFFEAIAKQSGGIFRTAFNIWLSQIESVQTGTLNIKALTTPDLFPVIDDLDRDDLFTLLAILQHGSLTPEEHAIVFQTTPATSRAQIDELLAREIVERDPGRPGFRVRPEALSVVREALFKRNLL